MTLVGALTGTIIPQVEATINFFDGAVFKPAAELIEIAFSGGVILLGQSHPWHTFTLGRAKRQTDPPAVRALSTCSPGSGASLSARLGAVFGVYAAALTALIERISSLVSFLMSSASD